MPPGLPGVDVKFLANVVGRLAQRRLHAYYPGARRSAAALILRFDDRTQRTLTEALTTYTAVTRKHASSQADEEHEHGEGASPLSRSRSSTQRLDAADVVQFLQRHCVDAEAPSSLQLLILKQRNMDASRWSGQIAFPGGRRDPDDADDFSTVCRETYEEIGLPLQHHREFICLGRLPDYKLHSRVVNTAGLVQARFVFLHVGDMTPTVQIATHAVESVRWLPLHRLTAAHVEHGCVAHPLQSFVHPQDADYRLMLTELFPSTYLTFPSIALPQDALQEAAGSFGSREGGATSASSAASSWRVWGLTLRSANELLALDNRQPFDWPLVESNSRVLQYGVLFPFHGYYELLYQWYFWRVYAAARARLLVPRWWPHPFTARKGEAHQNERYRRVLHGSAMERRYAALPASADALLFAAPEEPVAAHVLSFLAVAAAVVFVFYTVATVLASLFEAVGLALGLEGSLEREERWRAYYDANVGANGRRASHGEGGSGRDASKTEAEADDGSHHQPYEELESHRLADHGDDSSSAEASAGAQRESSSSGRENSALSSEPTASTLLSHTSWWRRSNGRGGVPSAPHEDEVQQNDKVALHAKLGSHTQSTDARGSLAPSTKEALAALSESVAVEQRIDKTTSAPSAAHATKTKAASVAHAQADTMSMHPRRNDASLTRSASVSRTLPLVEEEEEDMTEVQNLSWDTEQGTPSAASLEVAELSHDEELQAVLNRYRADEHREKSEES